MKIEINPGDRQLAFILVFAAVVLAVGIASAYNDPPGTGNPVAMGHSVDEMDWTNPIPGNLLVSGNVGIGTTSPGAKLDVAGAIYADSVTNDNSAGGLRVGGSGGANIELYGSTSPYARNTYYDAANHYFRDYDASPTRMAITSSGNVGIGTTDPGTNKLEVVGGPIKATGGLIIETRTTNPGGPSTGQMWLCTDPAPYCQ